MTRLARNRPVRVRGLEEGDVVGGESSRAPGASASRNRYFRVLLESGFQRGLLTCRRLPRTERRDTQG